MAIVGIRRGRSASVGISGCGVRRILTIMIRCRGGGGFTNVFFLFRSLGCLGMLLLVGGWLVRVVCMYLYVLDILV